MGTRMQQMRDSARLGIDDEQRAEGKEIEEITTGPAHDQRRHEQHEQVLLGRQAEAVQPDGGPPTSEPTLAIDPPMTKANVPELIERATKPRRIEDPVQLGDER